LTAAEIIAACNALVARSALVPGGIKPTRTEVRPLTNAYYELPGNECGGELHIVLDDHNYQRPHIRWCREHATKPETIALCDVLLLMSNSQRRHGVV
jgi:hypothetical protein